MDENIKSRIILILSILCLILLVMNFSSCSNSIKQKTARDKEMFGRLDLEEKMSKTGQQIAILEEKAKAKEKDLAETLASAGEMKKTLEQEQLVNQTLKDELQKVTKLKEVLEHDLKEALTNKSRK